MIGASKHKNGTLPSQRLGSKLVIFQFLVDAVILGLVISSLSHVFDRVGEQKYGIPMASKMEELLEMARMEDKYCLVKFEAPFCFPCTNKDPVDGKAYFRSVADQYIMYQLNALDLNGEGPDLTRHYAVKVLPTWLVLNPQGEEVFRWESSDLPPVEALRRVEALREISVSSPNALKPEEDEEERKQMYTLKWRKDLSYWEAITIAEEIEPLLLESVWTQPDSSGQWTVCSGTYLRMMDANKSRIFYREWCEHPLEIVILKQSGWQLPEY